LKNGCPRATDTMTVNKCGTESIGTCGKYGCSENATCVSSNQWGSRCLCKQPFCSDGKSCTCTSETTGTCTVLNCWARRKAVCVKTGYFISQCLCPLGTCSVCGVCQPIPLSEFPLGEFPPPPPGYPPAVSGQLTDPILAEEAPAHHDFAEIMPALILASASAFMIALPSALGASWAWRRWSESRSGDLGQPFIEISD